MQRSSIIYRIAQNNSHWYLSCLVSMMVLFSCTEETPEASQLRLESGAFNPNLPTIVFFGGGNCVQSWVGTETWENENTIGEAWFEKANVISFYYYEPDEPLDDTTYFNCAQMVVDTLASLAPSYNQPLQACGFSTGGTPALDLGILVNTMAKGLAYEVEQVVLMDSPCYAYEDRIEVFNNSGGVGKPRVVFNLLGALRNADEPYPNTVNAFIMDSHDDVFWWYVNTLGMETGNAYSNGMGSGAFWSVFGEGQHLDFGRKTGKPLYFYKWTGDEKQGAYALYSTTSGNGLLPEPVRLNAPIYDEDNKVLLTCQASENAVAYELLVGAESDNMALLGSSAPKPFDVAVALPEGTRYWTIRVRNQYGTSIFATPALLTEN